MLASNMCSSNYSFLGPSAVLAKDPLTGVLLTGFPSFCRGPVTGSVPVQLALIRLTEGVYSIDLE